MKLFHTATSPFVRKVMVAAHETGLVSRIETTFLRPSPLATDPVLSRDNPLSKIPVLVTDDGLTIYDSAVICDYLDTLHAGPKLVPTSGPARWNVLRGQALADGILEAAISVFYERVHRPKELWWSGWTDGQLQKVTQALDALDREAPSFAKSLDLGQIATACMLGWLEFRDVCPGLRDGRDALFAWYDELRKRPSMLATEPKA
jgi:glutathione S-transferase